ncbi:MAG TPA: PIN domain-containing protein [Candidatus Binatia bacterium]|nr:PIN domain-containing protein [Candidatus Binatia bacterium]
MIYVDASVLLAHLFAEDRRPPTTFWQQTLITSRLTEHEVWVRVHGRGLADSHGEPARELLARVSLVELAPIVLERALEPFPVPVRTRDALHLASIEFLRSRRLEARLASYDARLNEAAAALGIPLEPLP